MFDQQLDIFGDAHDLAPVTETLKLFESATQVRGQLALGTCRRHPEHARATKRPAR